MLNIKFKSVDGGQIPEWSDLANAGLDLYANEDIVLLPDKTTPVHLGIASEFAPNYVALLKERSGMGKSGIALRGGVIDSCYRGEWAALLLNLSDENYVIAKGDRVCQAIFLPVLHLQIAEVDSLNDSIRGKGGFGSSGK